MADSFVSTMPAAGADRSAKPPMPVFDWVLAASAVMLVAFLARAMWFTPPEALQGEAQKIFYIHVSSAVVGLYFACPLVAIGSALYLWLRDERLDRLADSAAELALVFISIMLVSGPLWAKPIWGTWWTWDARLTSTLFLWFILLSYSVLRGAIEDRQQRARYSAVLGILASLLVPFIHLSVRLFRTMHPQPIVLAPERPKMSVEMGVTLAMAFVAFTLLFVALLRARLRYAALRDRVESLEAGDA